MIFKKNISCDKTSLKPIREFVDQVLTGLQIKGIDKDMLILAVDEVCSNIIIHAHQCNPNESIELLIIKKKEEIVFEIHDRGEVFNITDYEEPHMETVIKQKRSGGMGLILVKKIMDRIQIESRGNINICRLSKTLMAS